MLMLDELGEDGVEHVMNLLAMMGRRQEAILQYDAFRQALAIQLGAEPGVETRGLYQRLRNEEKGVEQGNFPASLTPFIGRKKELSELLGWLRDPGRRLICVLGLGGSGKTRLALEAARRQRYHFQDGVYFVPLSALEPGSSLLATIAGRLGFTFRDFGDQKQQLLDYIKNKKMLLLLDSFETVVESASLVAEILTASEGSKVMVTSRARLNLSGEQIFLLRGMHYPSQEEKSKASGYSSVELFLDAARRVKPGYEPGDMQGIVRICQLVEGMPLSLLLASSWVEEYSEQEIAEQIEASLDFLSVEWLDLPNRQRSLRATFEYSWNMINEAEQQCLMDLSVFKTPFTSQAAMQVVGVSPRVLHSLMGKSLLEVAADGLFKMHDIVHQYSADKLAASPESQARETHEAHARYFLKQGAGWGDSLKSPGQVTTLIQADRIVEDVKTAWDWVARQADIGRLFEATEGIMLYFTLRYRFPEGMHACQVALDGISNNEVGGEGLNQQGLLLAWQASFHQALGELEKSRQAVDESCEKILQAQAAGHDTRKCQAMNWWTKQTYAQDLKTKIDYVLSSAALFQELGDDWRQAQVLAWAGELLGRSGNYAKGLEYHQQAVALGRAAGEPRRLAYTLSMLAYDYLIYWDWEPGVQLMEEATNAIRANGDLSSLAYADQQLGLSLGWAGRFQEGCGIMQAALAKMQQLGDRYYTCFSTGGLAVAQFNCGLYESALNTFLEVLDLARQGGFQREEAFALAQLGCLRLVLGNTSQALQEIQQSVTHYRQMGFVAELSMALGSLGLAQHLYGQHQLAWETLCEALRIAVASHSRFVLFSLPAALVVILADRGRWEQAVEAYSAVMTDPIVANSHWFANLVEPRLAKAREALPREAYQSAEQRGQQGDLFSALSRLAQQIDH
jgi:predicted ATPase/tetratricopeptide (TPR) repeat protein